MREGGEAVGPGDRAAAGPLTRRGLMAAGLAAGGLLVAGGLAACTSAPTPDDPNAPPPTGADDPDLALRTSVVAAEAALLASYDATIAAHPDLKRQLAPLRANHAAHLAAVNVGGAIDVPSPAAPDVPESQGSALRALAAAEKSAAAARGSDCLAAQRWQFSRELSLIGGCEAAHHELLAGDGS